MKRLIAVILAAVMTVSLLAACGKTDTQANLQALNNKGDFSGIVMMTRDGETVYEVSGGVENDESEEPINADTRFCVGSVSKQFTAAAVLILHQEGKLNVDDKLSRFFPDYRYGDEITVRMLLDMRSGIAEFYDIEYIDNAFTELPTGELRGVVTNDKSVKENRQTLESWLMKQPLVFEPDTDFEYSNSNYFLLARIVEIVSGKDYHDFVRERIFEPLGMNSSSFIDDTEFAEIPHFAAPTVNPQTVYVGVTMGLGDIISDAHDLDIWLSSLKNNKILKQESVAMMCTDYSDDDDEEDYGFGFRILYDGVFHVGSITTYETMVYTDVQRGVNIIAVTNDEPNLEISVSDIVLDLVDKLEGEDDGLLEV